MQRRLQAERVRLNHENQVLRGWRKHVRERRLPITVKDVLKPAWFSQIISGGCNLKSWSKERKRVAQIAPFNEDGP